MRRKTASYRFNDFKAVGDPAEGTFEAVVAVFGNVDLVGDRINKGAFEKSLDRWREASDPIPVIFDHQWGNLDAHVGEVVEVEERDEGLWVKAQLDISDDYARKLWNKMKRRRIREMSFAYDVLDEKKADDANELLELDIIEVGPTLKGANPATQLIAVKNDPDPEPVEEAVETVESVQQALQKSGRVLSKKNEGKIREAVTLLSDVLESVEKEVEGGKASEETGHSMTPADVSLRVRLLQAI